MEELLHLDTMRFIYREMSASEALDFSQNLENDRAAQAEFSNLLEAKMALPKVKFQPSDEAIENILRYSAKTGAFQMP